MAERADLPQRSRVVVVGGGVGGTSIAFHLAERGETDVLLLERSELTSGSTFHSAGLVGQLRADPTLTRMNGYSVELYRRLQQGDQPPGWVEAGGIRLASSRDRMAEIRRQVGWARASGLPLEEVSAAEATELFPLLHADGVVGGAYLPSDGWVDPSQLCHALAAGARGAGVRVATRTRLVGIDAAAGRVTGVRTDRGDVECEVVVDAGGMYAAEVARLVGVRLPLVPMSHQYVVTEAFLDRRDAPLPTLRDPDLLVYFRQEVNGLVMGGYERQAAPFCTTATTYDDIPADFNGRLLPGELERLEEITGNSTRRVPQMADVGIRTVVNGPEAFTPDNEFLLGESDVAGFFVAAGFCAHGIAGAGGIGQVLAAWVLDGDPGMDVSHMDVRRFGPEYRSPGYTLARTLETYQRYYDIVWPGESRRAGRPLRTSPAYAWHVEHGAAFGEKAGWERVDHYAANEDAGDESSRPRGWAGRTWSPATGAEHRATRERAALFDESSFGVLEVSGPDAAALLEWVCDNHVTRAVGEVTYTQLLNARGGVEADVTVTRTGGAAFRVVTGTASAARDLAWLRRHARLREADVRIDDNTGRYACLGLWGPRIRDVLAELAAADLGDEAFPFLTSRETTVGHVPVRAARVTYVGELGWELWTPAEYGAGLWRTLWGAGRGHGLVAAGYRAIESLRLECGYRAWGSDLTPETTPYEAGLGFCVALEKPGGFLGRDALVAEREHGPTRRLRCLVLDDPHAVALGGEPVRVGGEVVGRVTSAGFGYTVGHSIAYGYLPAGVTPGARVEVDLFGDWVGAEVVAGPLVTPAAVHPRTPSR